MQISAARKQSLKILSDRTSTWASGPHWVTSVPQNPCYLHSVWASIPRDTLRNSPIPHVDPPPPTSNPSHVVKWGYIHPYIQHTVNLPLLLQESRKTYNAADARHVDFPKFGGRAGTPIWRCHHRLSIQNRKVSVVVLPQF